MQIEYNNLGSFTFTAEDGRDSEWLKALAKSLNDDIPEIIARDEHQDHWGYVGTD